MSTKPRKGIENLGILIRNLNALEETLDREESILEEYESTSSEELDVLIKTNQKILKEFQKNVWMLGLNALSLDEKGFLKERIRMCKRHVFVSLGTEEPVKESFRYANDVLAQEGLDSARRFIASLKDYDRF